ncbi:MULTISPECIES: alpha/beta fold hydrolase [unclassified Mycoplasma]|uniref:alpha/beta fold hydrolase n=1 Tax=unclassified Mycoplasma TaxID=2683645 RepID=UPI00211C8793|nr:MULTISPECIES: alpha/beta hydrolase [unclassified Mycoplasma]UUM19910.1 alpha/beta hydrolase [Mycoplasma sp. 1578d]UUM24890.1 alpha/beta hydrolase [Mycoplasma sp. 3686d]
MNKVTINNFEIAYHYENENDLDKPLVLFFHGFGGTYKTFLPLLRLKRDFRFAALDFPGCGDSSSAKDITLEQYFDLVKKFLDTVLKNETDIYLVSHSLGSASALYLNKEPRVKGTLLLAPFNEFLSLNKTKGTVLNGLLPDDEAGCIQACENLFYEKTPKVSAVAKYLCQGSPEGYANKKIKFQYMVTNQIRNEEYLSTIVANLYANATNVSVLSGDPDKFTPVEQMEMIEKKYNFPTKILEKTGHAIITERPQEVIDELNHLVKK